VNQWNHHGVTTPSTRHEDVTSAKGLAGGQLLGGLLLADRSSASRKQA
jgi:hypothetical protein